MILLDQIPRNVYRGTEAKKVYNEVDPKARELCRIFIKDPKNYDRKELWQTWWFRSFFYMPRTPGFCPLLCLALVLNGFAVMHSEELGDHQLMRDKLSAAIDTADSEAEVKAMGSTKDFEDKHRKCAPIVHQCLVLTVILHQVLWWRNTGGIQAETRHWEGGVRLKNWRCSRTDQAGRQEI